MNLTISTTMTAIIRRAISARHPEYRGYRKYLRLSTMTAGTKNAPLDKAHGTVIKHFDRSTPLVCRVSIVRVTNEQDLEEIDEFGIELDLRGVSKNWTARIVE